MASDQHGFGAYRDTCIKVLKWNWSDGGLLGKIAVLMVLGGLLALIIGAMIAAIGP